MRENPGHDADPRCSSPRDREPELLVSWNPPHRVFLENLFDLLFSRRPQQPELTSQPAPFWPDVFVTAGLPWRSLASSGLYHVFAAIVIWGMTLTWASRTRVPIRNPFDYGTISYYSISEYLPELNTGSAPARAKERKGQPKYARQPIVSLPPAPDNFRQTIVTPSQIKLPADVPLPNIVAWTPVPGPVPEAALTHSARLTAPALPVSVVAPPPETRSLAGARLPRLPAPEVVAPAPSTANVRSRFELPNVPAPEVIGPPPSVDAAQSRLRLPNVPEPSVIEPPVSVADAQRPLGALNVAPLDPAASAPKLPLPEQRAAASASAGALTAGAGQGGSGPAGGQQGASPVPAAPAVIAGLGAGRQATGQLIALGIDPAPVSGPIGVPNGSRSGEFAATPEGRPDAPGTPEIKGGGTANGVGAGSGHGGNGSGTGGSFAGAPPGISVGAGPASAPAGAVAAAAPPAHPLASAPKRTFVAALGPSRVAELSRSTRPAPSDTSAAKIEDRVFAGRRYYSMILNMPNLTSSSGSWVIRFAELQETVPRGDLTAPVATLKVDPAYPADAIRDRVEGTVTLYAVIRKDGSVGEVRILRGVDERLDENARVALSRWHFRPATKNGSAVDLEAVVQIPFQLKNIPF